MTTQTLDRPLDPVSAARARHTAKAFDPARRIPEDQIAQLKTLLQLSPSSTNIQPWHFILASTEAGKARVAKGAEGRYAFNRQNILDASHVFVFASRLAAEEDYLRHVLAQEERDGRFASDPDTHKPAMHGGRSMFLNLHKQDYKDAQHWMDKQVYLNLGQFLLGISAMGLDATPMEGVDTAVIDKEFGLREKGFSSLFVVPVGYSDEARDYNAALPKSRLPIPEIITEV